MGFRDGGGGGCSLLAGRRVDCQDVDMKDNKSCFLSAGGEAVHLFSEGFRDPDDVGFISKIYL